MRVLWQMWCFMIWQYLLSPIFFVLFIWMILDGKHLITSLDFLVWQQWSVIFAISTGFYQVILIINRLPFPLFCFYKMYWKTLAIYCLPKLVYLPNRSDGGRSIDPKCLLCNPDTIFPFSFPAFFLNLSREMFF